MSHPVVRIARPSNDLDQVLRFYRDGLGFEVLASFKNHAGFDGIILGAKGQAYHFEFTREAGRVVGRSPSAENLVVFYLPDVAAWQAALARMARHGFTPVASHNPYWDEGGKTFEDFEGYRVVLFNRRWTL